MNNFKLTAIGKAAVRFIRVAPIVAVLAASLVSNPFMFPAGSQGSRFLYEAAIFCKDPGLQWLLVVGLAFYLAMFLLAEQRAYKINELISSQAGGAGSLSGSKHHMPNLWLSGFVVLAVVRYFEAYGTAVTAYRYRSCCLAWFLAKALQHGCAGGMVSRSNSVPR